MRALVMLAALVLAGCGNPPPMPTVERVDLARFMGDWYVIAAIPTFIEKDAYNAVESYRLDTDGTIATTFTFRVGSFDGEPRRYTPRGFVLDEASQARWGMQFIWPLKADYRIAYLAPDFGQTVIAREKRDYVWVMARQPSIADADYRRLMQIVASLGYDPARVRKVPQRWN